jgi:hypothetical protein
MRGLLVLALFLVLAECQQLKLPLFRGQYIQAKVSGKTYLLRVRFGVSDILLYSVKPPLASSTYDKSEGTEEFVLGPALSFRWHVTYTDGSRDYSTDPTESDDKITHQGVFGLGPGSDVFFQFDSWTLTPSHLILGWIPPDSQLFQDTADLAFRPDQDGTLTNLDNVSAPVRLLQDTVHIETLQFTPLDLPALFVVGMPLPPLILSRNLSEPAGIWHLTHMPVHPVILREYAWLFVALLLSCWIWYPGLSEVLHRAYWGKQNPEKSKEFLYANWGFFTSCHIWLVILALCVIHGSLESHKWLQQLNNGHLSQVLYWSIVAIILSVCLLLDPRWLYDESIVHRCSSLYLLIWLAVLPQYSDIPNMLALLSFSGVAFMRQSGLVLRTRYRRRAKGWWLFLAWSLTTLLAGCFFSFFTVAHYLQSFWPEHPISVSIQVFSFFLLWGVFSMKPFVSEYIAHLRHRVKVLGSDPRIKASHRIESETRAIVLPVQ